MRYGNPLQLAQSIDDLDKLGTIDWLAVVHADGNGLGQIFLRFHEFARVKNLRDYVDRIRRFSLALDYCTESAFCEALAKMHARWTARRGGVEFLPVVPLVLGGDDLTVVCDGRLAMQFACDFLSAFEQLTASRDLREGNLNYGDIIPKVMAGTANEVFDCASLDRVPSAAGVAIVKPHFPFHAAYELAEGLIQSAKQSLRATDMKRRPHSAVDFHVLYDASGPDLRRIRETFEVDASDSGKARLYARPYVVSKSAKVSMARTHIDTLEKRIKTAKERDENGRRRLPNHMLHELREGLFLGEAVAEHRLDLVRDRYRDGNIDLLLEEGRLFWREVGHPPRTALLDVMDLAEFWQTEAEG